MNKQDKNPRRRTKWREATYLIEFKEMIVKMLKELRKRMDEHSKKFNRVKRRIKQ